MASKAADTQARGRLLRRLLAATALLLAASAVALLAYDRWVLTRPAVSIGQSGAFAALSLPLPYTRELFDIGVTDVDGDGRFDIYSSNHNTRQILWRGDGSGGWTDVLSAWGLDQNPTLPGSEIADTVPTLDEPGIYIYWQGRNPLSRFPLVIRAHRLNEVGRLEGRLTSYSSFGNHETDTFTVQPPTAAPADDGVLPLNTLAFAAGADGTLKVVAVSPGVPITVSLGESVPPHRVFVGAQKARPRGREFELFLQDRHAYAWAGLNNDHRLDAYVSRGAIGGTLKKFPAAFQERTQDELLVSDVDGRYINRTPGSGISKRGCSARKAAWVDFDRDGQLDLFVNCMERGFVEGLFPKQLYRRSADGHFVDVAAEAGLALAEHEIIDFAWVDVDNDGWPDLVTHESKGYFVYRNEGGTRFVEQFIGRGKFARADRPQLKGTSDEYWFVDGKLAPGDFDGDGNIDVFVASKMGNALLVNDGRGGFVLTEPTSIGLPAASATAVWVDYDNDGRLDLYAVPQGLRRQSADGRFSATGLLAAQERRHMAAIANWADLDNDGGRDLLVATLENFSNWNWWERQRRTQADRFTWKLEAYRNAAADGNRWLQLQLEGGSGNPQAIGARVTARTASGTQTQVVGHNDGAFFSQGHYRLYFGLGANERVESLRIDWPDGSRQELRDLEGNRLHVIRQPNKEQGAT